ncbi:uncharacterized protein LOC130901049 [Diorhabda carinulata]|uniref:uncharacterized protein LOC130901049 n=1 Tax=Diorhabda carinulata TaxID=1163345 RepID=UPI0025A0E6A7|nr:uncharacterized protein LOC130901049 [Diorhabda carinulata]
MEPTMYLGAMSNHVHCENYQFKIDEKLLMFKRNEVLDNITWLDVKNASGTITPDTFSNVPNLKILNFKNCNLDFLQRSFEFLEKLTSVTIENSNIIIKKEIFEGNETISSLQFIEMKFSGDECFTHLKKLNYLLIDDCVFENSKGGIFNGLENLEYFILKNSKLTGLSDIFKDMQKTTLLSILNNKIGEFDYRSIPKLTKLRNLSIFNNEISTDIDYKLFEGTLLENIMFDTNVFLKYIDFRAFPALKCVEIGTLTDIITEEEQELIDKLKSMNIQYQYTFCGKVVVDMSKVQICG